MCAICKPVNHTRYVVRLRDCIKCDGLNIGGISAFAGIVCIAAALAIFTARRYSRLLQYSSAWAHLKILLSFVTTVTTAETQFGESPKPSRVEYCCSSQIHTFLGL
jgi:hypothetical protein